MDGPNLTDSRVWLLPILKQHVVGARIEFFAQSLMPLATRLLERARKVGVFLNDCIFFCSDSPCVTVDLIDAGMSLPNLTP